MLIPFPFNSDSGPGLRALLKSKKNARTSSFHLQRCRSTLAAPMATLLDLADLDAPAPLPAGLQAELSARFAADAPGAALGILHQGRCFAGSRGLAAIEPARAFSPQSQFRACSITKQLVALVLLQLDAEGRLSLDDPPSRFVPELAALDPRLRLWHLAQNRSGLPDYWCAAMLTGAQPETPFSAAHGRDLIMRLTQGMFAPGSGTRYNNGNFRILQWVIEAASGQPLSDLLQQRIFTPLGMHASYLGEDTAQPLPDGTRGYRAVSGTWEEEVTRIVWSGDAALVTTLHDLLRWEAAMLGLGPVSLAESHRLSMARPRPDGTTASYAFGLNVWHHGGRSMQWHSGALRGFRMMHLRFPQDRASVVVLLNRTESPMAHALAFAACLGLHAAWDRPQAVDPPSSGWAPGALFCPAHDLVAELSGTTQAPTINLGMETQLLQWTGPGQLASSDGFLRLERSGDGFQIASRSQGWSGLFSPLSHDDARPRLAGRRFASPTLRSTAEFSADGQSVCFRGPHGQSLIHPVRALGSDLVAIDCPRALDEPPPGRFHLRLLNDALQLSCLLSHGPDLRFHAIH